MKKILFWHLRGFVWLLQSLLFLQMNYADLTG